MKPGSSEYIFQKEARIKDYISLLKPRVMSLSIFTAFVGMVIAPGVQMNLGLHLFSVLCIALGAGAAGAMNMAYEAKTDALMKRTRTRPIPRGVVSQDAAWSLGGVLSLLSISGLMLASNLKAASLLAFSIFFYIVVYTILLKKHTDQNIVIGGAAGALPPVIGWVAVTNSFSIEPLLLFLIIFIWTPPHFWALALYKSEDYKKAGIPMLPLTAGIRATCLQIFIYTIVLAPLGMFPAIIGFAGKLYAFITGLMGIVFLILTFRLWKKGQNIVPEKAGVTEKDSILLQKLYGSARQVFSFSILYLFVLFLVLLFEHLVIWNG